MPAWLGKLAKLWVALGGTVLTTVLTLYPSAATWAPAVVAGITAVLVYIVPNAAATVQVTANLTGRTVNR
jgi:hypothetical protein